MKNWIIPQSVLLRMRSHSPWSQVATNGAKERTDIRATIALDRAKKVVSLTDRSVDIFGQEAVDKMKGENFEKFLLNGATLRPGRQHVEFERHDKKIIGISVETMESSIDYDNDKGKD